MIDEIYFEKVEHIGNLYLDYIFLEFENEPIFFTCYDDKKQLYLCLCAEIRKEQRWLVSKSDPDILERLINNEIDMSEGLCASKLITIITRDLQGTESSYCIEAEKVDRLDLPKEGTMLRCNKKTAMDYLEEKRNQERIDWLLNVDYDLEYNGTQMFYSNGNVQAVTNSHRFERLMKSVLEDDFSNYFIKYEKYCINPQKSYVDCFSGVCVKNNNWLAA